MARNRRFMPVPPEAVWDALADPGNYGYWVVGSKLIRDADPLWPAPGTRFHHTVGVGPFTINDHTESLRAEPPHVLTLRAKGRPGIIADVHFELEPQSGGTLVRMYEEPASVYAPLRFNPLVQLMIKLRNAESLARLEELALRRAPEAA